MGRSYGFCRRFLSKKTFLTFLAIIVLAGSAGAQTNEIEAQRHNLMPVPASIEFGNGELSIDAGFSVDINGNQDTRLQKAVDRMMARIATQTGLIFLSSKEQTGKGTTLSIRVTGSQSESENESYSLVINSEGVNLTAPSALGALRGIETFLQLIEPGKSGFKVPFSTIVDQPRFQWRGLLLDVCRHWMPPDVVKRTLDAMAAVKMNVLHWHLSEDQGFRVESKIFPKLHEMGSDGDFYTQEQIREIVEYARDRGIRVVPEFDMPGHAASWLVGYPELASKDEPQYIRREFGVHPPVMDPTSEEVYEFLDRFIGEMAALFPDNYFHIGGDEVIDKHWEESADIQQFMRDNGLADSAALQAYFNRRLLSILTKHGKRMVGWDEILHKDLPKDIVVQSWRGQDSLAEGAKQGYSGILSSGYYIDLFYPAAEHYAVDPLSGAAADLSESEKALILGGEACMWGEFLTPELVDGRIWPRAAAIAERLWSPAKIVDADDMYRRLEIQSKRFELLGLTHIANRKLMMKRMVGLHNSVEELELLASTLEPLRGYSRRGVRPYTSQTPLNRLVDAIPAESSEAREFNKSISIMLSGDKGWQSEKGEVVDYLEQLRDNHPQLQPILGESHLTDELKLLSETVSFLAGATLEAIDLIESNQQPSMEWKGKVQKELQTLESQYSRKGKRPEHEMTIAILPGIRELLQKCMTAGRQ